MSQPLLPDSTIPPAFWAFAAGVLVGGFARISFRILDATRTLDQQKALHDVASNGIHSPYHCLHRGATN